MSDRNRRGSLLDQMALAAAVLDAGDLDSDDDDTDADLNGAGMGIGVGSGSNGGDDDVDDVDDDDDQGLINSAMHFSGGRAGMSDGAVGGLRGGLGDRPFTAGSEARQSPGGMILTTDESEEADEFENLGYKPMSMDYQWNPTLGPVRDDSMGTEAEDGNGEDLEKYGYEPMSINDLIDPGRQRRSSYRPASRRTSHAESEGSFNSAPARAGLDSLSPGLPHEHHRVERRRPLSISVPNAQGVETSRRHSATLRRPSVKIHAPLSGSLASQSDETTHSQSSGSGHGLLGSVRSRKRRSTRRQNLSLAISSRNGSGSTGTGRNELEAAIEVFKNQDANNEWENVAAAAAVVSASVSGEAANKRNQQFAINETVLVNLTLLNVTAEKDYPKDLCTIAPVNAVGFPQGEGQSEAERSGPYAYVLSTVKHAHFDEDARYYTVTRADTGMEQRADSNWMEPLRDPVAIQSAYRAAGRTVRSMQDKPEEVGAAQHFADCFWIAIMWPIQFFEDRMVPYYRKQRMNLKMIVTKLLFGDAPFACRLRITVINLLVCCSFSFLFLELANLAFIPAEFDYGVAVAGVVIWSILALELLFEAIIRPAGYYDLITTDKAFAPSTARHVNTFHLFFEGLALLTFIPEFSCLSDVDMCTRRGEFSRLQASLDSVLSDDYATAMRGRFILGITTLRLFGLVRHWKQMWINTSFSPAKREGLDNWLFSQSQVLGLEKQRTNTRYKKTDDERDNANALEKSERSPRDSKGTSEEDERLKNAATIGTALMVVNSHRALILLVVIVIVLPIIDSLKQNNVVATEYMNLLQANNIAAKTSTDTDCAFLETAVNSWLNMASIPQPEFFQGDVESTYVLWAQLMPVRCDFQRSDGVITVCSDDMKSEAPAVCEVWDYTASATDTSARYFANAIGVRPGGIREEFGSPIDAEYTVTAFYNENPSIALSNMGLLFLLFGILFLGLFGLQALRSDAIRLVLDPLQKMLKIILRYAENPLAEQTKDDGKDGDDRSSASDNDALEEIGNYETKQLINAIAKIADLLRKCWGVAGAGIISSNLARTKDGETVVFNPTVPGKRVYALFGFVAINGFSHQLRALDGLVMVLINDVAKVVHDEVYRWALGDSGQCNKNLGSAFLMVFRIGDFSEVHEKQRLATAVVFDGNGKSTARKVPTLRNMRGGRKKRKGHGDGDTLQLASLPGIQSFSDRALLGMLKSFAGLHRDHKLKKWKTDFRLSAGVNTYSVEVIYGMDAGWAVEGAVGSEYKIDATYLSPHVNMASRMMSATKQYGVTILLSKAVEEILSRQCRKKLRHLDTVYVKGSKVKQDIFTYDARHRGVDFFLIERRPEQAEEDAEAYSPTIWEDDPDLRAMRQHVTDQFAETFALGIRHYLSGKWTSAYEYLRSANNIMVETVVSEGYMDHDLEEMGDDVLDFSTTDEEIIRLRNEFGDGACRVLMSYIERRNFKAPLDWDAVRPLLSK